MRERGARKGEWRRALLEGGEKRMRKGERKPVGGVRVRDDGGGEVEG